MLSSRILARSALIALPMLAGGCSGDVNPVKAAYIDAGYGPKPVQAPDFVEKSRRSGLDYMPVGESAPQRAIRSRSAEGQKALQADLEGARSRNEARGRAAQSAAQGTGSGLQPNSTPTE